MSFCSQCGSFVAENRTCSRFGKPIGRCAGGCSKNRGDSCVKEKSPKTGSFKVRNVNLWSPIKYYGGKSLMLDTIIANFPPSYRVYIEGFGGGASALLRKNPTPVEIYNDLGQNVYSLFKVLADKGKFARLKERMDLTYYCFQLRKEARDALLSPELSEEDRAYWFLISNRTSYNGVGGFSANLIVRRNMAKSVSDYLSGIDKLPEVHQRLSSVIIENRDFFEILERYDSMDSFFYLDPPYVAETRTQGKVYEHEMSDDDHRRLVQACLNVRGKVLLSAYDHPIYDAMSQKFRKVIFKDSNCDREEVLWRNYDLPQDNPQ